MMDFNHFDENGNARMVDISNKEFTNRVATASGKIFLCEEAFFKIKNKDIKKGDVLTIAQVAGIMATKNTYNLIPMTHPININGVNLTFKLDEKEFSIEVILEVKTFGKTGVEIEAITGVSVTLVTIYDMVKSIDKSIIISDIKLLSKSGGKSGDFNRC